MNKETPQSGETATPPASTAPPEQTPSEQTTSKKNTPPEDTRGDNAPPELSLWELMRASDTPATRDNHSSRVLANLKPSIWDMA